jgi:hypothetical protein
MFNYVKFVATKQQICIHPSLAAVFGSAGSGMGKNLDPG